MKVIAPANKKILPLMSRVLLSKIESHAEKTKAGIILPTSHYSENEVTMAKVVAVGPGEVTEGGKLIPVFVKVGDTVLIGEHGGHRVNDENLYLFRDEDIVGIIHD
ncbi:hypothetical protein SELMODRAFT_74469 [Selaginella moellendorffii]|uniref:10 kDa chaperonin n=2 Tax=Selaginella moellendorffii TaxID=88036 RepID=D8QN84_SELML|nr:hypothetical protein SELMODRAFT_86841 [Selaginella moellendorffii]EFJ38061.1 hypothetical protein SELMODRAFT_74469 [Selaginella moellendorffii]